MWVVAVFVEAMRQLEYQNFWIYISGVNVMAVALVALLGFTYYFQTQYVIEVNFPFCP